MTTIIGLDTATITGWSAYHLEKKSFLASGSVNFSKKRGESNGVLFLKFNSWLQELLEKYNPSLVVYEQAHHRGGAPTEIGVNLTGRVQERCEENKIEYVAVRSTSLKLFATGAGNASKDDMIYKARKIIKRETIDDNEADAIHVAMWGASEVYHIKFRKQYLKIRRD